VGLLRRCLLNLYRSPLKIAKIVSMFLSEMLKSAGVGKTPDGFGGGSGEDQFASFMRDEQAKLMTQAGGIGLAQTLYDAMIAKLDE